MIAGFVSLSSSQAHVADTAKSSSFQLDGFRDLECRFLGKDTASLGRRLKGLLDTVFLRLCSGRPGLGPSKSKRIALREVIVT